jgi:hypothetical protein
MKRAFLIAVGLLFSLSAGLSSAADNPKLDPKGLDFFEKKIRPVLVANCYQCHSASAKEIKGELRLDTKEGIRKGGEQGHAVVPGKVAESLIVNALRHEDGMEMPPNKKLPDDTIADFIKWIEMGAPDPRNPKASTVGSKISILDARKFWSFQPPKIVPPAVAKNAAWATTEIDRYILAGWEAKNLTPVAHADRLSLLRRATFDLVGLPPSPAAADAFLADASPQAFEKVVDRLLASEQFGERWGRHWLDVARYGESTGKERNVAYPYAWRYRDYVYDAFNADKPYDQFLREQIAGDLLPAQSDAERNSHLIATGFLTLGPKSLNERNAEQYRMDIADEQLDVTTRAAMGLSVACARCHDHKFDPIPTADYYALAGIFRSTQVVAGIERGNNKKGYEGEYLRLTDTSKKSPVSAADRKQLASLQEDLAQAQAALTRSLAAPSKAALADLSPAERKKLRQKLAKAKNKNKNRAASPQERRVTQLAKQIRALEEKISPPGEPAMGVREADRVENCRVNIRGEVADLGPEVPRGYVRVLTYPQSPDVNPAQSGRAQLAAWLTSRHNPLTARVMANRVWYHLFGRGIVETVDNFGALGEAPTHPELLDYLAVRFMEQGWSNKKLIREIMLSRTYRLSSAHNAANYALDPENKLVWRMSRRRLDAEAIRDAILAVGGQLDLQRPHGSLTQGISGGEIGRKANTAALTQKVTFRSAYLPLVRGMVPEFLSVFDVADPELVVGQRDVTTVATQALFMMNSPLVREQSQAAAERLLAAGTLSESARIDQAFRLILGRPASDEQRQLALAYLHDFEQTLDASLTAAARRQQSLASLCQSLFASAEFRYLY